ncbi:MAG: hypothetical protein AAFR37_19825, partial [Cyanobacteria bacterium J06628_3]
ADGGVLNPACVDNAIDQVRFPSNLGRRYVSISTSVLRLPTLGRKRTRSRIYAIDQVRFPSNLGRRYV